jgi:hypothetical protein
VAYAVRLDQQHDDAPPGGSPDAVSLADKTILKLCARIAQLELALPAKLCHPDAVVGDPGNVTDLEYRLALTLLYNQARLLASPWITLDALGARLRTDRLAAVRAAEPDVAYWCGLFESLVEAAKGIAKLVPLLKEFRPGKWCEVGVGSDG